MKTNFWMLSALLLVITISFAQADNLVDKIRTDYNEKLKSAYQFYNEKNYSEAIRLYREYIDANVNDSGNMYNLACCYGLNNQPQEAAEFLVVAYKKGFTDINHIENDPDFERVRDTDVFKKAVEEIKSLVPEKKTFGEVVYYPVEIYCKSRIYESKSFNADTDPALVVAFHGWGDNVDNFSKIGKLFDEYNVVFLTIQAPYAFKTGKNIGYSWAEGFGGDKPELADITRNTMVEYAEKAVKDVRKKYNCDKTFITGFSQGGWLTYLYGIRNYKTIDAMIPMGGFLDTNLFTEKQFRKASKIPVHIIHGNEDKVVNYGESDKAFNKFREEGYNVKRYTFDGAHVINGKLMMEIFSELLEKSN